MSTTVVGIDAGHTDCGVLEHLLEDAVARCGGPVEMACTHLVDGHWAGSLELSGPAPAAVRLSEELGAAVTVLGPDGARTSAGPAPWQVTSARAADEVRSRSAGRAVRFVGQEQLVGEVDTADVLRLSAITALYPVAGIPTEGTRLVTRNFLRPVLEHGELVLQVRLFADDGRLVPYEVPNPVACCAAHS